MGVAVASAVLAYAGSDAPEGSDAHAVRDAPDVAGEGSTTRTGADEGAAGGAVTVVEIAELAGGLFSWGDPSVAAARAAVLASDLLVVATPVYKASYTGLLKSFLDQFGRDELAALATVPLMVGAAPIHSLAVEEQLRPVLVEIGASCPTRGLFVLEKDAERPGDQIGQWLSVWGDALVAVARTRPGRRLPPA